MGCISGVLDAAVHNLDRPELLSGRVVFRSRRCRMWAFRLAATTASAAILMMGYQVLKVHRSRLHRAAAKTIEPVESPTSLDRVLWPRCGLDRG